jgi:hypothetical protein
MSGNNVQNGNEVQNNSKATRNHVLNKKSLSWLDDDDEIEEKSDLNRDTNQKKTDALIEDVEDPMQELREAWNRGEEANIPEQDE